MTLENLPATSSSIALKGLRCQCLIGIFPHERLEPQPLDLELELFFDSRIAAFSGALSDTLDYAQLMGEIRFILQQGQFRLIESAAEALCNYLLAPPTDDLHRPQIAACRLKMAKPLALDGHAIPTLEIVRQHHQVQIAHEHQKFGRVDIVFENPDCGLYRLRIAPGRSIPTHIHRRMHEAELILGQHLHLQGHSVAAGNGICWPHNFPHRYDNPADVEQTVLCIDKPRFDPDDEIEVDAKGLDQLQLPKMQVYFEKPRHTQPASSDGSLDD